MAKLDLTFVYRAFALAAHSTWANKYENHILVGIVLHALFVWSSISTAIFTKAIWVKFINVFLMNNSRIFKVYFLEFLKNFGHSIGVKGGDSGGKRMSWRPRRQQVVQKNCTTCLRRVTAGAEGFCSSRRLRPCPAESVRPKRKSTESLFFMNKEIEGNRLPLVLTSRA